MLAAAEAIRVCQGPARVPRALHQNLLELLQFDLCHGRLCIPPGHPRHLHAA